VEFVEELVMFLDGFALRWVSYCGKITNGGRELSKGWQSGALSGIDEMTLITKPATYKDAMKLE